MKPHLITPLRQQRSLETGFGIQLKYKVGYIRDGKRHFVTDWVPNLIQDIGLNNIASYYFCDCWKEVLWGNAVSPVPTRRNSGAVNISQSGNTLTASGSYFVSQDVGRLFKFDSGPECYITGYTSGTSVTVSTTATISPAEPGTIWYVNETALTSVITSTNSYGPNGGDNSSLYSGNVATFKRTFVGSAVAAPVTLTEIGFSNSTTNADVFDRDIITGGVSLITGDQPLAVCEVTVTFTPDSAAAQGNLATGFDSSGSGIITAMRGNTGFSSVNSNGTTNFFLFQSLEPSATGRLCCFADPYTLPAFQNGSGDTSGTVLDGGEGQNMVSSSYSSGSFTRTKGVTFTTSQVIGTVGGFAMTVSSFHAFCYKVTTPFAKTSSQTLNVNFRLSWQRILSN